MGDTSETAARAYAVNQVVRKTGPVSLLKIALDMKVPAIETARAVGWLEREGKVVVTVKNGEIIVSISKDGIPMF